MEQIIFSSIILLFVVAGLVTFIKDAITAAKNPLKKHSKYYIQGNHLWYGMETNHHSSGNYDATASCDSGSFDIGGDCGVGN